jgi:hypothetical protein
MRLPAAEERAGSQNQGIERRVCREIGRRQRVTWQRVLNRGHVKRFRDDEIVRAVEVTHDEIEARKGRRPGGKQREPREKDGEKGGTPGHAQA